MLIRISETYLDLPFSSMAIFQPSRNKHMWKSNLDYLPDSSGLTKKSKLNHWNHQLPHLQGSRDSPTTSMFEGQPSQKTNVFSNQNKGHFGHTTTNVHPPPSTTQHFSVSVTSPLLGVLVELVRRPSPKRHRSLLSLANLRFVWTIGWQKTNIFPKW